MRQNLIIILLLLLITSSCKEKSVVIDKFIYARAINLVYDSVGNPYLGIIPYFQYTKDGKTLMALGKVYDRDSIAPPHGLIQFFELKTDINISERLNQNFTKKEFDSTYNTYFDPRCIYFLYETSNRKKHIITCGEGGFPNELADVFHCLENYMSQDSIWIQTTPFSIDSLFLDYERNLFANYPPPSKSKVE